MKATISSGGAFLLALFISVVVGRDPDPYKCIGLSIEGGGDKGAFETGAL